MSGLTKDELYELAKKILAGSKAGCKATVVKIGVIIDERPTGFEFDGRGAAMAAIEIKDDGQILYGGWTVDELAGLSLAGNPPHGETQ